MTTRHRDDFEWNENWKIFHIYRRAITDDMEARKINRSVRELAFCFIFVDILGIGR